MAWYSAGSVALTNGSNVVIGTGTSFLTKVQAGDMFIPEDGSNAFYEIAEITASLQLVLKKPYQGATAPQVFFSVVPTQSYLKTLASQVADLITIYSDVPANVADAQAAAKDAQAYRNAAVAAQTSAESARDASDVFKGQAATSATAAATSAATAGSARDSATQAKTDAVTAKQGAETARDAAVAARTGAETARDSAAASASQAAQSASNVANKMDKAGGTFSGVVAIQPDVGTSALMLGGTISQDRYVGFLESGTIRWAFNAGQGSGHLYVIRYDAQGRNQDAPVYFDRNTGQATFAYRPVFAGAMPWDNSNLPSPATQGYVDTASSLTLKKASNLTDVADKQAARDALSVPGLATGNTFTQDQIVNKAEARHTLFANAGGSSLYLAKGWSGGLKGLQVQHGDGNARWGIYSTSAPESGGNVGSNFSITRYADNGAWLGDAFTIARSDGSVNFSGNVSTIGTINQGWTQSRRASQPGYEWHILGISACMTYLLDNGDLVWANSNGGAGWTGTRMVSTALGNLSLVGTLSQGSDSRIKTDIKTITNALEKVNAIRGVTYRRLIPASDGLGPPHPGDVEIGVVAQEVQEVAPEAVSVNSDTGYLSVAYGNLVGLALQAIKELATQVESLQARLDSLQPTTP